MTAILARERREGFDDSVTNFGVPERTFPI
jgi:hypothetical protein